jgi:predicted GNAT superfamily acetyltransferase
MNNKHIVAVEDGLTNVKQALMEEGYQVIDLDDGLQRADAYVITGMEEDLSGVEEIVVDGYVVDATGRQTEEIIYDLEKHFRLMDE